MGWPSQSRPLRARPAMCGALGRASVKSGAANQRSLNMSTPSIAKSRNPKTAASKKKSVQSSATLRRKVTSAATPAKAPPKRDEPKVERATKQERLLTLLSHAEGATKAASRRKVTSPAANAKKPTRSVESKAVRVAAARTLRKADEPKVERVTKQERLLTLLSRAEGASIAEMMQATGWQQHSVRGFWQAR
jgi:hypothetical protein